MEGLILLNGHLSFVRHLQLQNSTYTTAIHNWFSMYLLKMEKNLRNKINLYISRQKLNLKT